MQEMTKLTARLGYYFWSTIAAIALTYEKPWAPKSLGGAGTETYYSADPYIEN